MRDELPKDPVCHMPLDERPITYLLDYEGCRYYFCSIGCRAEFERHPQDYVQGAQSEHGVKDNV